MYTLIFGFALICLTNQIGNLLACVNVMVYFGSISEQHFDWSSAWCVCGIIMGPSFL